VVGVQMAFVHMDSGRAPLPRESSDRRRAVSKHRVFFLVVSLTLCFLAFAAFLLLSSNSARAQDSVRYVATTGVDSGGCTDPGTACRTVQYAVDVANDDDVIKVGTGLYTDVHLRPPPLGYPNPPGSGVVTQTVYLTKSLTIRGGYNAPDYADPPDPEANPTTLDAQGQGRVLLIAGTISPTVEGLRITGGEAPALGGISNHNAGAGIYVLDATVTISNNQIFSNGQENTTQYGGGLYVLNGNRMLLSSNTIRDNKAGLGGGLFSSNSPDAMLVTNIISGNRTSGTGGGGLYFKNSPDAMLISNTIASNVAGGLSLNFGGGLQCTSSNNMTLVGNVIRGNIGDNTGGGLRFLDCDSTELTGNVVIDNRGGNGGGLEIQRSSGVLLFDNVISNNSANRGGGGAYFEGNDNVILEGNVVAGNYFVDPDLPLEKGAGLNFTSNASVNLSSNMIIGNYRASLGGGLYIEDSVEELTNNIIAGNQVDDIVPGGGHGSGMYIHNASPRLLHTTIADNSGGAGSGIYVTGTNCIVVLTNTIIVSHAVGVTVTAGNSIALDGVLWWENQTNTGGDGEITLTEEYTGDPAFVDPESGDYHIGPGSAAVDLEMEYTEVGVPEDIDGEPRPMGWGSDYGADELLIRLALTKQANPNPAQAGAQLTYTLRATNTGAIDLHATITDVLPAPVTPSGILTWTPVITAPGGVWEQVVIVTVDPCYGGLLNNMMQVTTEEGVMGMVTLPVTVNTCIYLPLVLKSY
jgi:uncharacterized repeat protein (TIGR01451 family)